MALNCLGGKTFLTFMRFNESLAKLWTQFYSVFILVSCFGFFLFLVFVLKKSPQTISAKK